MRWVSQALSPTYGLPKRQLVGWVEQRYPLTPKPAKVQAQPIKLIATCWVSQGLNPTYAIVVSPEFPMSSTKLFLGQILRLP